jgi:hypothetical protein
MTARRNSLRSTVCLLKEERKKPRDDGQASHRHLEEPPRQQVQTKAAALQVHFFKRWERRDGTEESRSSTAQTFCAF